jgi:hypothetical protein
LRTREILAITNQRRLLRLTPAAQRSRISTAC